MFSTVSGRRAERCWDTVIPAALNNRSRDELDAGTHSSLLATRDILAQLARSLATTSAAN